MTPEEKIILEKTLNRYVGNKVQELPAAQIVFDIGWLFGLIMKLDGQLRRDGGEA